MSRDDLQFDLPSLIEWFRLNGGGGDEPYLTGSYDRFVATHDFASPTLAPSSTILDVGAHWLHQAVFFARDGHTLICADVSATTDHPAVQQAAVAMGASLVGYRNLDKGEGIADLAENSVDAILFCEIIEHITYNPVEMWREFYRVLKPGGRLFVTTPNSLFYERILQKLNALFDNGEYGIAVNEILEFHTFGHHWKEFSAPELRDYFARLSPDYEVTRIEAITTHQTPETVQYAYRQHLERDAMIAGVIPLQPLVQKLDRMGAMPFGQQLLCEVILKEKAAGITAAPAWMKTE